MNAIRLLSNRCDKFSGSSQGFIDNEASVNHVIVLVVADVASAVFFSVGGLRKPMVIECPSRFNNFGRRGRFWCR